MASTEDMQMYLQLSPDPIRFEPVSRVTNVFFDGTTKEVVSVRGGGTLGVVVQGMHTKEAFCMEHRGNITSLKFAPDHSRLAVQRTQNSLELLSFSGGKIGPGVVVECKTKNATLLGFVWVDRDDLILVTSHGVEFYQVSRERVFVRLTRNYSLTGCCWFVWSSECHTLVVATTGGSAGPGQVPLYPFQFAANYSNKMQKCLVDLHQSTHSNSTGGRSPQSPSSSGVEAVLNERDVCVAHVYRPALLVLKHPRDPLLNAQLLVYIHLKESTGFKLTHVCQLELTGSFAVNVIDSLIIVHHQASKISLVFDVALGTEMRQGVCYVYPATRPASIRRFSLEEPSVASSTTSAVSTAAAGPPAGSKTPPAGSKTSPAGSKTPPVATRAPPVTNKMPCQLYAPTWVVFQPSVIIDARLGCLWSLQLDLPAFAATFADSVQLMCCLLNRRHAKPLVLRTMRAVAERRSLHTLGPVFDRTNAGYRRHLDAAAAQSGGGVSLTPPTSALLQPPTQPCNVFASITPTVVVETVDVFSSVLSPMMEEAQKLAAPVTTDTENSLATDDEDGKQNETDHIDTALVTKQKTVIDQQDVDMKSEAMNEAISYLVSVTLDYCRSLSSVGVPVPAFLHQLTVNALLSTDSFFQLHQLLQYHVIPDSKPLACVLLSRAGVYPACEQLSLDMLARLQTAHEEIIEVLLANRRVTLALRYARANGLEDTLSSRKFLEAALLCGDDSVFHAAFTLFAMRNTRLRGARPFGEGDHCDVYVNHFKKLFGNLPNYSSAVAS